MNSMVTKNTEKKFNEDQREFAKFFFKYNTRNSRKYQGQPSKSKLAWNTLLPTPEKALRHGLRSEGDCVAKA